MVFPPTVFETVAVGRTWLPQHKGNEFKSLIKGFFIWVSIHVQLKVRIEPDNTTHTIEIKKNVAITDLLKKFHMKPDGVIVLRKTIPLPIDEALTSDEPLKIIRVASGG